MSGSEVAFFSLDINKLKDSNLNKSNPDKFGVNRKFNLVVSILEQPKDFLASILIVNNFLNVAIVILSVFISNELFDLSKNYLLAFILQVVIVSFLILIFGETIPKMFANHHPFKFALLSAKTIKFVMNIAYPFSILLVRSGSVIEKRINKRGFNISKDELSHALDITSDESAMDEEKKYLKALLSLVKLK